MEIHLIWAQDINGGIGKNNKLPWHIPQDLNNFKKITSNKIKILDVYCLTIAACKSVSEVPPMPITFFILF